MSMKNGDMPAHPTGEVYFVGEDGRAKAAQGNGMTKREMMAMHAPSVPDWFASEWERNNGSVDMYFELVDKTSFNGMNITVRKVRQLSTLGHKEMFFAWRVYYADQLLAELEVSK
ncbi:MAG: hypothetical protein ACRDC6_20450 [Shewanella sp.]